MQQWFSQAAASIKRILTRPVDELNRAQRSVRYGIDLARHCARELQQDNAPLMAAALTYRTIFSLIPMAALSLVLLRAFGGLEQIRGQVQNLLLRYWGLYALTYEAEADNGVPVNGAGSGADTAAEQQANLIVEENIGRMVDDLIGRVLELDFASIGVIGLVVLIYAALALALAVEDSFNAIFTAPRRRSWSRRITTYWSVLTLSPVLLLVSLYVTGEFTVWVNQQAVFLSGLLTQLSRFTALGASWLLLFLLYALMPNTRVNVRAAAIGGLVAACLWELGKVGFQLYVRQALPYSALYGTLGLIPLFLFWVYVTWLIVLFGAELTYSLQTVRGRRLEKDSEASRQMLVDGRYVVPMMVLIVHQFDQGKAVPQQFLAATLRLPLRAVEQLGKALQEAGLLHELVSKDQDERTYSPARSPDHVTLAHLLGLARQITVGKAEDHRRNTPGWKWLDQLRQAEQQAAGDLTLRQLVDQEA